MPRILRTTHAHTRTPPTHPRPRRPAQAAENPAGTWAAKKAVAADPMAGAKYAAEAIGLSTAMVSRSRAWAATARMASHAQHGNGAHVPGAGMG